MEENTMDRLLLTEKEAVEIYSHSRTWFWEARNKGLLPYIKNGKKIVYDRRDLDKYFESLKQQRNAA